MSVPSDCGNYDDAKDDTYTPLTSEGSASATADPARRTTHNTSVDDKIRPTDNNAHIQKGRQLGGSAFGDVFQEWFSAMTCNTRCLRIPRKLVSGVTLAEYVNAANPHLIEEREASSFACQILSGIRTTGLTLLSSETSNQHTSSYRKTIVKLCDYGSLKELREGD